MITKLKAPFPYFGGKARVANEVWRRFGDVANYVEPFAGSLAVLLARPTSPKIETVNDLDGFISNFWRAVAHAPEEVAHYADWPVSELDLHARHAWLVSQEPELVERLRADPDYYNAKIAGWWVWGICQWIGSGWCKTQAKKRPHLRNAGGVHRSTITSLVEEFQRLSNRLRRVRITCGDWSRVLGPSVTHKLGITSVFLDPPYGDQKRASVYKEDSYSVDARVREWCLENGNNPQMRIALCGYVGEGHDILVEHGWTLYQWKTCGGYGNQGNNNGRENKHREAIWFSPHCLDTPLYVPHPYNP